MTDVLTPEQRRFNMSRIRGRDTAPELLVRSGLHARGFRFRLHEKRLPGHPDLVFPRYRTVLFVHGCFWHAHGCRFSKLPRTRESFWKQKIGRNADRDRQVINTLMDEGWRVLVIWECALRGRNIRQRGEALKRAAHFVTGVRTRFLEINGPVARDDDSQERSTF
jgi:DNA mismatch endonuclease, patch repair protein